ncbi:MAG: hypothetical protein M1339_02865, partial [Bacteroidetes bacterium]|nr:hypothetical protein [Bacteroidota bacterium]
EGGKYGSLLTGSGDTASYLPYTGSRFRFVASGSIDSDSVRVGIRVGAAVGMLEKASPGGGGKVVESTAKSNGVPGSESRKGILTVRQSPEITDGFMYPDYTIAYVEVVSANRPKLVILQPTAKSGTQYITNASGTGEPVMPADICEAQLQNYNGGQVTYNWQYTLGWELPTRSNHYTYTGTTTADGSVAASWTVPFSGIFRGGAVTLVVTATTTHGKTYSATVAPDSVLGDNPSIAEATQGVSRQMQVVMFLESSFRQFETNPSHGTVGYPLYGPGKNGGYGICQLDNPPATDEELWNWKNNRDAGMALLNEKYQDAVNYPSEVRSRGGHYQNAPNFTTTTQVWEEAFQEYNGGHYWLWRPVNKNDFNGPWNWQAIHPMGYGHKAWNDYVHPVW